MNMRGFPWLLAPLAVALLGLAYACGGSTLSSPTRGDAGVDAVVATDAGAAACTPCTAQSDCTGGAICAPLGGSGSFCVKTCETSSQCASDETCTPVESPTGGQAGGCVPRGGVCGGSPTKDAGSGGITDASACSNLVPPDKMASCQCPSGRTCSPNGCRYQEYCNTTTNTCQPAPVGCGTAGGVYDGGAPPTGSVGADGGSVSRLLFGIVGDTRPPSEDDTSGYPTQVITKIFADIQALSPRPSFLVSTGDYQFSNPTGTEAATQLDLYEGARAQFTGPEFPTMGNHECTGLTNSNCGMGNTDGITNNFTSFLQKMLAPIGQTDPNYEIDINASDSSWTSKFLFVAGNSWDQTKANWLDQAMSRATTYTFLVRHEPASASSAPGVGPAEVIMTHHPYTLSFVGHTHTYQQSSAREVIIGNGGAPLSGGVDYGFGMVSQQADGSIAVDMIDYSTGLADATFHFAVKPDGSPAQ
jgi:hypothetical protein